MTASVSSPLRDKSSAAMLVFHAQEQMNDSDFIPFDPLQNGASNLVGDHNCRVRIDFQQGNLTAGIFQEDPSSVDLLWPFTEHAFVFSGKVRITDLDSGVSATYGPGDGWVIKQGSRTKWEVLERLTKSFFQSVD